LHGIVGGGVGVQISIINRHEWLSVDRRSTGRREMAERESVAELVQRLVQGTT